MIPKGPSHLYRCRRQLLSPLSLPQTAPLTVIATADSSSLTIISPLTIIAAAVLQLGAAVLDVCRLRVVVAVAARGEQHQPAVGASQQQHRTLATARLRPHGSRDPRRLVGNEQLRV